MVTYIVCVLVVSIFPHFYELQLDFRTVLSLWYSVILILFMFFDQIKKNHRLNYRIIVTAEVMITLYLYVFE